MKKIISTLLFFVLLTPLPSHSGGTTAERTQQISALSVTALPDPRIGQLTQFFTHYHASTQYINDYLNAADQNQIDYRLLPAISIAESSGGTHACGNNWWGWASCKGYNFSFVVEGIQFVTKKLGSGDYYRGKTIDQKLRAYNPNPAYTLRVQQFMREIAPNP